MYDLFDELPASSRGNLIIPQFIYIKGAYGRELAKLTNYYQLNEKHVNNSHLLVKLLLSLNVSFKRDFMNFVDVGSDKGMRQSVGLRMTSSLSHGYVFTPGIFYGDKTQEVIIAHDEDFDLTDAYLNWRDLEPIRILSHPFTDLNMGLPNGNYQWSTESGIAVIAVNVRMLVAQYRRWVDVEKYADPETAERIHQFIASYPIANAVRSHFDIAVFNRLSALMRIEKVAEFKRVHPFHIYDNTQKLDFVLEKTNSVIEQRKYLFDHLLTAVPMVSKDTLFEVMKLPWMVPTRQVKWALVTARLPLIEYLVKTEAISDSVVNKGYLNDIRMAMRSMKTDRSLEAQLPAEFVQKLQDKLYNDIWAYL